MLKVFLFKNKTIAQAVAGGENMRTATYQIDANKILESTFSYLVKHGLENVTIRELCKGTKIVQGSMYYWFGDKTSIICEATQYGLKKVTDEILEYVFKNMGDLKKFFSNCLAEINRYKKEIRFIYQMAASPVYDEKIRIARKNFNFTYNKYINKLSVRLQCDEKVLRPLVYLFISAVLDYVIWDEEEKSQIQLDFIYSAIPEIVKVQQH